VVANPLGVSWGEYRPLTVAYVRVDLTPDVDRRNAAGTPLSTSSYWGLIYRPRNFVGVYLGVRDSEISDVRGSQLGVPDCVPQFRQLGLLG
jgi:hypothetical protein